MLKSVNGVVTAMTAEEAAAFHKEQSTTSIPLPVPQVLSFAQFVVGLTEQGWITPQEGTNWLTATSLPAAVEAAINALPATAEDGSMPRLRARARALRPSEVVRSNPLLLMMAAQRGATAEDLDTFFRVYAAI